MEKLTCSFCAKECSKMGLGVHVWRMHGEGKNFDPNRGYKEGTRAIWNKGLTKQDNSKLAKSDETKHKLSIISSEQRHSEETKKKISSSMKKAHIEGRAHNIGKSRWNNEPSYPERFFAEVIKNEFDDKNYIKEYSIGKYSIDFAWVDRKLAVEIDGKQHEDPIYKERDLRKDEYLIKLGWKVLRIKWKDLFNKPKKFINIAKEFIHQ